MSPPAVDARVASDVLDRDIAARRGGNRHLPCRPVSPREPAVHCLDVPDRDVAARGPELASPTFDRNVPAGSPGSTLPVTFPIAASPPEVATVTMPMASASMHRRRCHRHGPLIEFITVCRRRTFRDRDQSLGTVNENPRG
jgi:hypothetical protein